MQTIHCIYCKRSFEITEALADQISDEEKKQREEEIHLIRLEEQAKTKKKIEEELKVKDLNFQAQLKEDKEQKNRLMQDLLKANEDMRALRKKDEERELENQKKFAEMEAKVKEEATKKATDEKQLEILQMKKQLEDTQKALEEAKRKSTQGSQQLQGEVLELELEEMLRNAFPRDEIIPVAKGITGADIKQVVKSPMGNVCGVILWEIKQTKTWDDKWIGKLKNDERNEKASLSVLVSTSLPKDIASGLGNKEGIWVCKTEFALILAELLHKNLWDVAKEQAKSAMRTDKVDLLYQYVTSHEFQQQIEMILESYTAMKGSIDTERRAYERLWKQREEQAEKIFRGTAHIIGSMQGRIGTALPQIRGLDLFELTEGN